MLYLLGEHILKGADGVGDEMRKDFTLPQYSDALAELNRAQADCSVLKGSRDRLDAEINELEYYIDFLQRLVSLQEPPINKKIEKSGGGV